MVYGTRLKRITRQFCFSSRCLSEHCKRHDPGSGQGVALGVHLLLGITKVSRQRFLGFAQETLSIWHWHLCISFFLLSRITRSRGHARQAIVVFHTYSMYVNKKQAKPKKSQKAGQI